MAEQIVKGIVAKIPEGYYKPSGKKIIRTTEELNVRDYATAQVYEPNLIPENIAKDVNVLGVVGTHEGGAGGIIPSGTIDITENGTYDVTEFESANVDVKGIDTTDATATANDILLGKTAYVDGEKVEGAIETYDYSNSEDVATEFDKFILGQTTDIYNDRVATIAVRVFDAYSFLKSADFPNVTQVGDYAFNDCKGLETINFPNATTIGSNTFGGCTALGDVTLPEATKLGTSCFYGAGTTYLYLPVFKTIEGRELSYSNIETVRYGSIESMTGNAFYRCYRLTKIIIEQNKKVCELKSSDIFTYAYHFKGEVNATYNPEGLKDGRIFVPDELLNDYKSATNWSTYADIILPLSELEVE
jgi:hypothetical protein